MNQCPYCNVDIAHGYVGEVELESHLKEIHEVSFQTMHDAEAWWDKKYVQLGRQSWEDMNIGERRKTINAYLRNSISYEMRGFLKCPTCGITFNDSENTDDELTLHLMKDHGVPEDLAEEITTFEIGSDASEYLETPWASFKDKEQVQDRLDQLKSGRIDGVHDPQREDMIKDLEITLNESLAKEDYYNLSSDDYDDMIDEEPDDPDPESVLPDEYYEMKNHDKLNFDKESKAIEEDPDFLNDPDYQGFTQDTFGNQVKSHPSQYTLSGWDHEEKERLNARGDVDFAFDSKASERVLTPDDNYRQDVKDNWLDNFSPRYFKDDLPRISDKTGISINGLMGMSMKELDDVLQGGESKANEAVCPKCNGYGGISELGFSDIVTCPKCNGSGEIHNYYVRRNGQIEATYDNFIEARDDALAYGGSVLASPNSSVDLLDQYYAESKANEDSLVKIEDNNDDDTQITLLDEWKNESNLTESEMNDFLTQEGFLDDMEKQLNKVGVNLDRDPEQVESIVNEMAFTDGKWDDYDNLIASNYSLGDYIYDRNYDDALRSFGNRTPSDQELTFASRQVDQHPLQFHLVECEGNPAHQQQERLQ